jgi:hypothetical protein
MVKLSRTSTGRALVAASRGGVGAALRGARFGAGVASDFAAALTAALTPDLADFAGVVLAGAALAAGDFTAGLTALAGAAFARALPFAAAGTAADFLGITDSIVQQAKQYSRFAVGVPIPYLK